MVMEVFVLKNIIFDLGGVLLDFNPLEYIEYLGFSKEEGKLLQSFIWSSTEWKLADINKITYENLINGICKSKTRGRRKRNTS